MEGKFKELKERAKKLGLNLWEHGGYYYLSGFIRGGHRQGIFTDLHYVEKQIRLEEKLKKEVI